MNIFPLFLPFYGITVMAALLNIKRSDFNKIKIIKLFILGLLTMMINIGVFVFLGHSIYSRYYVIWVQIPSFIAFSIISPYKGFKLLFVLLTAITFSAIPVFLITIVKIFTSANYFLIIIGCILSYVLILMFIFKFMRPDFTHILEFENSYTFLKLSFIPALYYLYVYLDSGYMLSQIENFDFILLESIPHIIVFIFYFLLIDIFKIIHEKQVLSLERSLLSLQIDAAAKQIEILRSAQEQTTIYRHDMRHHFSLIYGYLLVGDLKKAQEYLELIQSDINDMTPIQYCKNNSVNLILISFANKAKKLNISLLIDVSLPKNMSIPETELYALFSNALENAIQATSNVNEVSLKKVHFQCRINNNQLLLSIENNFVGNVIIENGIPISNKKDHGIGTKSISSIVSKRKGRFAYEITNQVLILRVVLPL